MQDATALQAFLRHVEVLEVPVAAATHYGQIRADDLFIAAHARSLGLRLVTNNIAEFSRVKELILENWTLPVSRSRSKGHE
jgi:tRNA(fMet)-specific endonuclease VapC